MSAVGRNSGMFGIFPTIRCVVSSGSYPVAYFHIESRSHRIQKIKHVASIVQGIREATVKRARALKESHAKFAAMSAAISAMPKACIKDQSSVNLDMVTMVDDDHEIRKDPFEKKHDASGLLSASAPSQSPCTVTSKASTLADDFDAGKIRNRGLDLRDSLMAVSGKQQKQAAIEEFLKRYGATYVITGNSICFDSNEFAWAETIEIQDACSDHGFIATSS